MPGLRPESAIDGLKAKITEFTQGDVFPEELAACRHLLALLDPEDTTVETLDYDQYAHLFEGRLGAIVSQYVAPRSSFRMARVA